MQGIVKYDEEPHFGPEVQKDIADFKPTADLYEPAADKSLASATKHVSSLVRLLTAEPQPKYGIWVDASFYADGSATITVIRYTETNVDTHIRRLTGMGSSNDAEIQAVLLARLVARIHGCVWISRKHNREADRLTRMPSNIQPSQVYQSLLESSRNGGRGRKRL